MSDEHVFRLAELMYHAEGFLDQIAPETLRPPKPWVAKTLIAEHSGDCTKQPWSCMRCHAEDYVKQARWITAALSTARREGVEACPDCDLWKATAAAEAERGNELAARLATRPPAEDAVERAKAALQPFADAAEDLDDETDLDRHHLWESPAAMNITAGHLRIAHAALAALSRQGEVTAPPPRS